jgi:hypothetical protein
LAPGQPLTIGLLTQGTLYDDVVKEILDHQGICYETIEAGSDGKQYPLVLLPKESEGGLQRALAFCRTEESVIVVQRIVDLERIRRCLSGIEDNERDSLEVPVNAAESQLLQAIRAGMERAGVPLVVKPFWPHGEIACLVMTHDIDWLRYSPFHMAVYRGTISFPGKVRAAVLALGGRNFGWNLQFLVEPHSGVKPRPTLFLRTSYEGDTDLFEDAVRVIKEAGSEMAVHAAHNSHLKEENLRSELEAFRAQTGDVPKGLRYHIFKFKVPETWIIESQCGLEYDATFARNRFFGFRPEVCYPYRPFATKRLDILELPTSFMDWTALNRGLRGRETLEVLENLMRTVERFHGVFVVNFHNTYLNRDTFPDIVDAYEWVLKRADGRYWMASAQECARWWKARQTATPHPRLLDDGGVGWDGEMQLTTFNETGQERLTKP